MSFQQGLSGLNAASKSLDTIGNNVANANTVGFKSGQTLFADVYANSLTGSGASQIGIGVKVAQVSQQFTQGNITSSNNPLDIAINGGGFFRLSDGGTITYSRNGQFQMDNEGYIINANGSRLTGYTANTDGDLATGAATDIHISSELLNPSQTTEVNAGLNLDSRLPNLVTADFDMTDPTTYSSSTSVSIYDVRGVSHVVQTFYVKTGANTWDVYAANDGALVLPAADGGLIGTLTFDASGELTGTTTLTAQIDVTTGATSPFDVPFDYTGTTSFGTAFSVNSLIQDGYTSGRLSSFNVGADGIIIGSYTNGKSSTLGQVVLANFTNPNGLQPLGNNVWAETSTSGPALVSTPNSGTLGVLQSSAVEDSNVDLTAELVNMITAQRYYQANAKTISTQDEIMQTLVNL